MADTTLARQEFDKWSTTAAAQVALGLHGEPDPVLIFKAGWNAAISGRLHVAHRASDPINLDDDKSYEWG